jgi:hypothetical protein
MSQRDFRHPKELLPYCKFILYPLRGKRRQVAAKIASLFHAL